MPSGPRVIDRIAAAVAHLFYRIDVVGEPPPAGPLLLLPNHFNALLDPALVMATAGRPIRFLAKSTLFGGPFRPLLAAADAIPVYRKKDGVETGRNDETFSAVASALAQGQAVCVFPEGISHSSGRLETLRTGAARMALSAVAAGVDVRLVPVGINLERKTVFRSRATIAYGRPFGVAPPAATDRHAPAEAVRRLTVLIAEHVRALLVEADPERDAALVERVNRLYLAGRSEDVEAGADLARRRTIADAIARLRAERPDFYEASLVQLRRYDDRMHRFGLDDSALDWEVSKSVAWRFIVREVPLALVLAPVAAAAAIALAVPYTVTDLASKAVKDTDVTATAKVMIGAIVYTCWIALLGTAAWWVGGSRLAMAILLMLPVLAVAGLFAIERESAAWRSARSWLALRGAHTTTRRALQRRRAELAEILDHVSRWITANRSDESAPADHVR